jgi:hypothetical protein
MITRTLVALALSLSLVGCGAMQVANNQIQVKSAVDSGKAVLISRAATFNPNMDIFEANELAGQYRPPLTYWRHRSSGKTIVLGGADTEEGRGKVLTNEHFYYVLEPGLYDLLGYVQKSRLTDVSELPVTNDTIKSNIGFVNFSKTELPSFYTYEVWVPPGYTGSTFDGNTLTHWYGPGYFDERGATYQTEGMFIDMRGLVPYTGTGEPTLATFFIEPGQIRVVPDFKLEYTHGACDVPVAGQWVCPLTSLMLSSAFTPQHADTQALMRNFRYSQDLVNRVDSAYLLPGAFFAKQKMEVSERYFTKEGAAYGKFRVTNLTMPSIPMQPKK